MSSKRTAFSKSVPLPGEADWDLAVSLLHNHGLMIELNPLVFSHGPIQTPRNVPAEEASGYQWHQISEEASQSSNHFSRSIATYKACYLNLRNGVNFHVYGPQGLDIKERWTVVDSRADQAFLNIESEGFEHGLYLRRDCNLRAVSAPASFSEKNLYHAHQVFIARLNSQLVSMKSPSPTTSNSSRTWSLRPLSFFGKSRRGGSSDECPSPRTSVVSVLDPADIHPAFRHQMDWSLVPDGVVSDKKQRPLSLVSDSSSRESKLIKKRPAFYLRRTASSIYDVSNRSSLVGSVNIDSSLPPTPSDEDAKFSLVTNLSPAQIVDSAELSRSPARASDIDIDSDGSVYSVHEDGSISQGNKTPSLVDETSDEESTGQIDELPPTPSEEMSVLNLIQHLRSQMLERMTEKEERSSSPPPIPERAAGHTIPAPLKIRPVPMASISVVTPNHTLPMDLLPARSTSVRRPKASRRSSSKFSSSSSVRKHMSMNTEETERTLSLSFRDGFFI